MRRFKFSNINAQSKLPRNMCGADECVLGALWRDCAGAVAVDSAVAGPQQRGSPEEGCNGIAQMRSGQPGINSGFFLFLIYFFKSSRRHLRIESPTNCKLIKLSNILWFFCNSNQFPRKAPRPSNDSWADKSELFTFQELQNTFRRVLCDVAPSVMAASLVIFHGLARTDPASIQDLVPSFVSILKVGKATTQPTQQPNNPVTPANK